MKLVPKPEGFELRDRSSNKTGMGSDWLPADAVYSAQQRIIKAGAVDAVMVIWREVDKDGNTKTCLSFSGNRDAGPALIMNATGKFMSWQK